MADVPHFDYPFRWKSAGGKLSAAVNEQHSPEDIAACCAAIVLTPIGSRDELPEFGVTPQTFRSPPLDVTQLLREIAEWEDRATLDALTLIDSVDPAIQEIIVNVAAQQERGESK